MKIDIQNDTKNNKMTISVSVEAQQKSRDPVEVFMWKHIEKLLKDYKPPAGYEIGNCHDKGLKVDNRRADKLQKVWTFDLLKKAAAKKKVLHKKKPTQTLKPAAKTKSEA